MHQGRRINIPVIEESSFNWVKFARFDSLSLNGRPSKVLKKIIDLGFSRNWWDGGLFEDLIIFGWDRGYLRSDLPILSLPFKYFLKDMNWSKAKRLQEVDSEDDAKAIIPAKPAGH